MHTLGKLKKWDTVDEVHKSIDIPEAPKKNGAAPSGNIPLPPPPPPGGLAGMAALSNLMKPFSKTAPSPDSSIYSPGNFSHLACLFWIVFSLFLWDFELFHSKLFRWSSVSIKVAL